MNLNNHPFAVEAFFESSVVLTFACPKEELQSFIPPCVELDTFQDKYAFIAIALVQTKDLRPKSLPSFLGNNFFLIGYRIFVRYTNNSGKKLRGLYIIKSETNKKRMEFLGKLFTKYNYATTDINLENYKTNKTISSNKSNFHFSWKSGNNINLPANSVFKNWKEARRFAGPLPFTFTYNEVKKQVLIIQGMRQNWKPNPIEVIDYRFEFLENLNLKGLVFTSAFEVNNIPYYWKKGKIEQWK